MAISSEDAEQMMADIVREIQKNFHYDHIGIGIMDYATKDIEIKAEAGSTSQTLGRRIPVGSGVLGKVARSGVSALVQNAGPGQLAGVLPESAQCFACRSVMVRHSSAYSTSRVVMRTRSHLKMF